MSELRDFVAEILERQGAAVEAFEPDALEVLAPEPLRQAMEWPELIRLAFGVERPSHAISVGLEEEWLDRFGALLGEHGRWSERQLTSTDPLPAPTNPDEIVDRALSLLNAVWRLQGLSATFTRCRVLTFRYMGWSDEKHEGMIRLGLNLGTGAVVDEVAARLWPLFAQEPQWQAPEESQRLAAGTGGDSKLLESRVSSLLKHHVQQALEPFMRGMRHRLKRDRDRVYTYFDTMRSASLKRLSALSTTLGEKSEADRQREMLRVAAFEREYHSKLDDLRRNYALRVKVEWMQILDLYLPVQRFDVVIRRRKAERLIQIDWHPLVRMMEPPPCDWGIGLDRQRLVCDEKLHLTDLAGQAPCPSCGKLYCRACHRTACPRCGQSQKRN
ncbi:MAG: hypothetical protein JO071_04695 [Deltaproteobacteria bacterium]|nr:hypothetical protein [Deltaproteobacteria bacterium]